MKETKGHQLSGVLHLEDKSMSKDNTKTISNEECKVQKKKANQNKTKKENVEVRKDSYDLSHNLNKLDEDTYEEEQWEKGIVTV